MGWLRLAAILAVTGLAGIFLRNMSTAITDGLANDGKGISMPPSWLLSTAQFGGIFLLTLAAAIANSMRSQAGSLRALWRILRGTA